MVNNNPRKVVYGACVTKAHPTNGRTYITNGPVYDLAISQQLLREFGLIVLNEVANFHQKFVFSPELSDEELVEFIVALQESDYENSERCATSVRKNVDCDSYAMKWNRQSKNRWVSGLKIYVKFGFFENNPKCLVISIHPANR